MSRKTSPTQRSLANLRERGYTVAITERWNPFAKLRQDLFGFIDLLAFRGNEVLAVQSTSGTNVSHRVEKIKGIQAAALWLESPHRRIVIHGWAKKGAKGKRKLWELREVELNQPHKTGVKTNLMITKTILLAVALSLLCCSCSTCCWNRKTNDGEMMKVIGF